ncbi:hypothetical protein [Natronospora cellulosivora (SeqCode)]
MKGFDRPLKPEWIYKMIQILEVGDTISQHRDQLDEVLVELDGKYGKRKVITVLSRYFLKDIDNVNGRKVEDNLIFNMIKNSTYQEAKPLMVFNLLVKAPILQHFSKQLYNYYEGKDEINSDFLRKKSYEKIGERDIAGRSLRNFLSTLTDFGILIQEERGIYKWGEKIDVSEENMINFFKLYSKFYLTSPQISLYDLAEHLFFYFNIPDLQEIAQEYNNEHWQYVRRVNAAIITMK